MNLRESAAAAKCSDVLIAIVSGKAFRNDQSIVGAVGEIVTITAEMVTIRRPSTQRHLPLRSVKGHAIAARDIARVSAGIMRRWYAAIGGAIMQRHVTGSRSWWWMALGLGGGFHQRVVPFQEVVLREDVVVGVEVVRSAVGSDVQRHRSGSGHVGHRRRR